MMKRSWMFVALSDTLTLQDYRALPYSSDAQSSDPRQDPGLFVALPSSPLFIQHAAMELLSAMSLSALC